MNGNKNLFFIFFFISLPIWCQSTLKGKVVDVSGVPLYGASIIIKDVNGGIIAYGISSNDGSYTVLIKDEGTHVLEVNFLGFEKQLFEINVESGSKITQNVALVRSGEVLKEVVIKAEQPVKARGDTLIFDAKALTTGVETVVEDLLKNIPGITIQKDGTIRFNDKPVEKIMIEGDDLFNQGYAVLTKNMPSRPLNTVEVLQRYSNNKLLKGIEESEKVALNLTLQNQYKNLWFGDLLLGSGNENTHTASANLMHFTKKHKTYFTSAFNNAGYDKIGSMDAMVSNSVDLETIGLSYRAAKVIGLGINTPNLDKDRARFNDTQMATLSTILPLGSKGKLKLLGFLGFDELLAFNSSNSVTDFDGTFFENNEFNNSTDKIRKSYINALLNYDLSETQMLQASATLSAGRSAFTNSYFFNETSTREALETRNSYFDQKITYTHKWKNRNVVLLKGRFFTDRLPQNYGIDDYLLGNLFSGGIISGVGSNNDISKQFGGLEADFRLKQKNSDLISFAIGFENNRDQLASRFSLFTDDGIVNPADFQSNVSYRVGDLYVRSGYVFKFNKFTIGGNVNAHQLFNNFRNNDEIVQNQNVFLVNPTINFNWEIKPDNRLQVLYNYNITNSNLLQVNDAYLLTSSRSFTKGLGDFNQFQLSNVALAFTSKHYLNRYSFSVRGEYSTQNNLLGYRSQLNQNTALSELFAIKGGDRLGLNLGSNFVIRKLQSTVRFDFAVNRLVYFNQFNDSALRKNTAYNQLFNFRYTSNFKTAINFSAGTEWNYSQVVSDNTFKNSSKYSYLNLKYEINEDFNVQLNTEHYNFGGVGQFNNYFFSDFQASYAFKKDKYVIGLDGRNLFNADAFTTYNVSDIGYATNSYQLLPRYIMLTFKLQF